MINSKAGSQGHAQEHADSHAEAHAVEAGDARSQQMMPGFDAADGQSDGQSGVAAQWAAVQAKLRGNLGEARFKSWFGQVQLIGVGDGAVSYAVPTSFARDYIQREFGDHLLALWRQEDPSVRRITLIAEGTATAAEAARALAADAATTPSAGSAVNGASRNDGLNGPAAGLDAVSAQPGAPRAAASNPFQTMDAGSATGGDVPLGTPLLPHLTFDNFVVGKSNQLAYAAARRVAEADGAVPFNPLYLYGPVGLGKTHLMHAIGAEILRRDPGKRVVYLSAERFMYHFVNALRHKDTVAFKHAYRSVDVLMVDDVQFIGGKDSTQEEFFHTFNALVDHNRQIIISADRSPSDLEGIEERIRSRLGHGLACDILPTDYELRLGILHAKAETMLPNHPGVQLSDDVINFLASSISSSIRELEGALTTLIAHAELIGRPMTVEHAQDILRHLVRANEKRITIDDIQRKVADYYNLRLVDMSSPRRSRSVARPRQVAMYLCKHLTTRSLPEIGRKFGGRDHTTVLHGVNKIEQLRAEDKALDEDIGLIRRAIEEQ
ncbi:chromosomal replication initiator protein DnaA [Pyruvatibacter mobilis]|uniref:chromosomal replication initiator protein DnaA n=1 Tax=Pyruvatibacter mobilis TaxID=1712261 RepID=UPI003BA9AB15